jgi:hypothetical protein
VKTRQEGADLSIPSMVGAPCFSRGSWTSSPAENRFIAKDWALALDLSSPALKRMITGELLSRNAEALLPSAKAEGSHLARGVDLESHKT